MVAWLGWDGVRTERGKSEDGFKNDIFTVCKQYKLGAAFHDLLFYFCLGESS